MHRMRTLIGNKLQAGWLRLRNTLKRSRTWVRKRNHLRFDIWDFENWELDTTDFMENYGVQPDIMVENRPEDTLAGRDRQLESAVEELMKQLNGSRRSNTTEGQQK